MFEMPVNNNFGINPYNPFQPRQQQAFPGQPQMFPNQQTTTSKLDQIAYGLASSGYETAGLINGVNTTMLQGFNELMRQLSDCCCIIQRGLDSVNYNAAINTSNIIQAQERGTQKIWTTSAVRRISASAMRT